MACNVQGSHEQEASSRYNSGYGASTSAASSARFANIFTLSCQDVFVLAASVPVSGGRFALLWYAGLSFPVAVTTCAANRHKGCFTAIIVLMESLLSKQQHLHASL